MGKKAYMGPMQDPNGINAQILPIWVPYIHVCWVRPIKWVDPNFDEPFENFIGHFENLIDKTILNNPATAI